MKYHVREFNYSRLLGYIYNGLSTFPVIVQIPLMLTVISASSMLTFRVISVQSLRPIHKTSSRFAQFVIELLRISLFSNATMYTHTGNHLLLTVSQTGEIDFHIELPAAPLFSLTKIFVPDYTVTLSEISNIILQISPFYRILPLSDFIVSEQDHLFNVDSLILQSYCPFHPDKINIFH